MQKSYLNNKSKTTGIETFSMQLINLTAKYLITSKDNYITIDNYPNCPNPARPELILPQTYHRVTLLTVGSKYEHFDITPQTVFEYIPEMADISMWKKKSA